MIKFKNYILGSLLSMMAMLGFTSSAHAVDLTTQAMTDAITAGFTDVFDTIFSIVGTSLPGGLKIVAAMLVITVVVKVIRKFT